ncbi:cytochrome P450 72A397-like [Diospyros lotus]|uniref:cytochrome P450 72A397-like n=1 Tax=Diospyros lotus TaxID=55363 RepID=UPI00225BA578|nr:cytochrome P450 72A397-like [Diospyros lotus]
MKKPCDEEESFYYFCCSVLRRLLFGSSSNSMDKADSCSAQSELELLFREYANREINALLWIGLILVTALLLRKLAGLFRLWAKGRPIPGPPSPSFFGHSRLFSVADLTEFLSKSHQIYGAVVKLWLGPTQLLVSIKDPEDIKDMLLKAVDKLPTAGRAFHLSFGRSSLFVSSFNEVQKRRDLLETEINGKLLERANVIPTKVLDCVMERILDVSNKGSLDCKMVSQHFAFTILGTTLFGDAFLSWSEAAIYEELLMTIAKEACFWASYRLIPFWRWGFWRYQYLCTKFRSLTQDIIQLRSHNFRVFYETDQKHNGRRNTVDGAVSLAPHFSIVGMPVNLLSPELDGHLNPREPCGNVISMMFHGCLTTAGLIGNVLVRLATNFEIQDKIHSEIVTVREGLQGKDQQGIGKMVLLLATLYESARLLPAGPLLQRCSLSHDLNLKTGVTIPSGAILVVPVQLVQMDDSNWGSDASQFNPYRFLSKAEKRSDSEEFVDMEWDSYFLKDPNENAAFLPFGYGTRACLGQKFAILGVATLFASLLEYYEIRLQPGFENNPEPVMNNCVLQLLPSPKIVFVKRNS